MSGSVFTAALSGSVLPACTSLCTSALACFWYSTPVSSSCDPRAQSAASAPRVDSRIAALIPGVPASSPALSPAAYPAAFPASSRAAFPASIQAIPASIPASIPAIPAAFPRANPRIVPISGCAFFARLPLLPPPLAPPPHAPPLPVPLCSTRTLLSSTVATRTRPSVARASAVNRTISRHFALEESGGGSRADSGWIQGGFGVDPGAGLGAGLRAVRRWGSWRG